MTRERILQEAYNRGFAKSAATVGWTRHLPSIRAFDTVLGAAAGGLIGGLSDDKDKKKRTIARRLKRILVGAGIGAGVTNLLGDRARRYISNRIVPVGYNPDVVAKSLIPESPKALYRALILDAPRLHDGGTPVEPERRELFRRGLGLHGKDTPSDFFRSIHGDANQVEFRPDAYKRLRSDPQHAYYDGGPGGDETGGRSGSYLSWLLGNFVEKPIDVNGSAGIEIKDVWDVALHPGERKSLLSGSATGQDAARYLSRTALHALMRPVTFNQKFVEDTSLGRSDNMEAVFSN